MARKSAKKKQSYARPVPGNTMTVTLPIEDIIRNHTGGRDIGRCSYEWKAVQLGDLLKAFPLYKGVKSGSTTTYQIVPTAFKVVSVGVTSGWGFNDANQPDYSYGEALLPVGAAVRFNDGQLFEQSPESARTMKCKPSAVPTIVNASQLVLGAWNVLNDSAMSSTQSVFEYKGELKYVTIAFRLPDNTDLGPAND